MKNLYIILIVGAIGYSFSSCTRQDPLEKERAEFLKSLEDNTALTVYRGVKITLRSFPVNQKVQHVDSLLRGIENKSAGYENVSMYTIHLLNAFFGLGKENQSLSLSDAFEVYNAYNELKEELKNKNEDDFPTLLEVILYLNSIKNKENDLLLKDLKWNNSKEHLVLSAALMGAKPLPASFQLYETSKLEIPQLENTEIKPLAALFKGVVFMQNKWNYLSEEALSQGIESLDAGNLQLEYPTAPKFFEGSKIQGPEAELVQLHALSCLLRGYVRTRMDDEDRNDLGVEDFELFLKDAEKIGADNELVWFAGTYVAIKKEDNERAIAYLDKLHGSDQFTENEKNVIAETKIYLNDREKGKALNTIYDKIFIGKLLVSYIYRYSTQIGWYKSVSNSESGKMLLSLPEKIDAEYQKIEKEMSTDGLKEKGKELLKDVF